MSDGPRPDATMMRMTLMMPQSNRLGLSRADFVSLGPRRRGPKQHNVDTRHSDPNAVPTLSYMTSWTVVSSI